MENSFAQISELFAQFSENAKLQIEKGNKAAGMRARKASLELEKLLKTVQKRITGSLQMISFGIRTTRYQVKSLCASQRRGFWLIIDSLWLNQFNFRVSVGFGRLMVGNSTSADFCDPFCRNAALFQFRNDKVRS